MSAVKSLFNKYLKGENKEQTLLIFAVASLFLPYVLSAIVLIFVVARALILKESREIIFKDKDAKFIFVFMLFNFAPPLIFKNYLGFAAFLGLSGILFFAIYLRNYMTKNLFNKIADVSAFMSIAAAFASTFIKAPEHDMRSPSVFFNPNYYGAMITFMILLCAYRFISKEGNRVFLFLTILANIYGLLMADCQSAFFSIALGLWVLLLFKKCYKSFAAVTAVAVLGVIFLPHLTFIMPRISGALENILKRADIWQAGFKAFLETPVFGRGLLAYRQIGVQFGGPFNNHCHNILIDALLSFGIIGCIPLVIYLVKNIVKIKGKECATLILAFTASVILHGLVDVTLIWIQTGAFAAFLLSAPYIKDQN